MGTKEDIRLILAGPPGPCAAFLEALPRIEGARLAGLADAAADPESLRLAKAAGVPMARTPAEIKAGPGPCLVLRLSDETPPTPATAAGEPREATVIEGPAARLLVLMARTIGRNAMLENTLRHVRQELDQHLERSERIIGKSEQIATMRELIGQVAPTPTPVLLLGETGVGKDLAARNIHQHSLVKDKPFISVNCTALTPSLMESELFGYKKGAFTGAEQDRAGLLEEAHGGTLFLDEIGDMGIELQAKMLRFLQTGEVRRVGDAKTRIVTTRVIAATNRDLEDAAARGLFRRDLFYRFNTFTIRIAPLRERKVDIPYLAYHFLTQAEAKLNKKVASFSDAALARLAGHDWPGNVRELSNVIERAVILVKGEVITPSELPPGLGRQSGPEAGRSHGSAPRHEDRNAGQGAGRDGCRSGGGDADGGRDGGKDGDEAGFCADRERIMANFEKRELLYYLKQADGNVSEACRLSGIPRRTFYRKMRKYGL